MSFKSGYRLVALPAEMVDNIGQYIIEHTEQGSMSIPRFVQEAVRVHLEAKKEIMLNKANVTPLDQTNTTGADS